MTTNPVDMIQDEHDDTSGAKRILLYGTTTNSTTTPILLNDDGTIKIEEILTHEELSDMPDVTGTNSDHDSRYYTETEIDNRVLSDLSDVTTSSIADNELLAYDTSSSNWINQTPTEAGLDNIYLKLDGSNANTNIDIGTYDLTTAGDATIGDLTLKSKITLTGANRDYLGTMTAQNTDPWNLDIVGDGTDFTTLSVSQTVYIYEPGGEGQAYTYPMSVNTITDSTHMNVNDSFGFFRWPGPTAVNGYIEGDYFNWYDSLGNALININTNGYFRLDSPSTIYFGTSAIDNSQFLYSTRKFVVEQSNKDSYGALRFTNYNDSVSVSPGLSGAKGIFGLTSSNTNHYTIGSWCMGYNPSYPEKSAGQVIGIGGIKFLPDSTQTASANSIKFWQTNANLVGQDSNIEAMQGAGTDKVGGTINIKGGKATGNAAGGSLTFQTSTAGSSGTSLQSWATRLTISPDGLQINDATSFTGTGRIEGLKLNGVTKTANYTMTATDDVVLCNTNSFTITLPNAVLSQVYTIKNIASVTTITIATTDAATIDGDATWDIYGKETIRVINDGTDWWIV